MKIFAPSSIKKTPPKFPSLRETDTSRCIKGGVLLKAFTLIELLVVIVIIGILATISVAQFNSYQEKARFAKAQAFATQVDTVLMAETMSTGYGFPLRLDFEEGSGTTTADSSGSGNDLNFSSTSMTWSNDTGDNSNYSLSIDSEQVSITNVKNMPVNEISFSAFVKLKAFPSTYNTYPVLINSNSGFVISPTGEVKFYINAETQGITQSKKLQLDRWHHFMGSYKNGVLRFFVDGDLIDERNHARTLRFNQAGGYAIYPQLTLGYPDPAETGKGFKGSIDRVRIYPVGLDPDNL